VRVLSDANGFGRSKSPSPRPSPGVPREGDRNTVRRIALTGLIAIALLTSGCTKFQILNSLVPSCGYRLHAGIPYGPLPRQTLDVCEPLSDVQPLGVVVFFYGGDWQYGSKEDYRFVGQALASRGYVAILPDYRLYPPATFPAFVEDGALAVRWAHDHAGKYRAESRPQFLMGHSAGAYIAAMLTLDRHYLRAVGLDRSAICATAGLSGPYDFTPPPADRAVFDLKPGEPRYPAMEPVEFADGFEPPLLLIQGGLDDVVDPSNTKRLSERIRQRGGAVKTIYYADRGHAGVVLSLAFGFRWLAPTLRDVTEFFRQAAKTAIVTDANGHASNVVTIPVSATGTATTP
jgi:acetyl esterase/lipase